MKDFIFIIGPSAVGKTTLAKSLFEHYKGVYIEQNMVPEFSIPENVDIGLFEEQTCWDNTLMQLDFFHKRGFKNIIALDFDDLRTRDIPIIFKGYNFITLKLIASNDEQIRMQMIKRHEEGEGLFALGDIEKSNRIIMTRELLPNEVLIDVYGKSKEEVLKEAINVIDNTESLREYDYVEPSKDKFLSWVKSNNLY